MTDILYVQIEERFRIGLKNIKLEINEDLLLTQINWSSNWRTKPGYISIKVLASQSQG